MKTISHLFTRCLKKSCSVTMKKRLVSRTSCSCWETRWSCRISRGERNSPCGHHNHQKLHINSLLSMFLSKKGLLCLSIFRPGGFAPLLCFLRPPAVFEEVWMCYMVKLVPSPSTPCTDSRRSCSTCLPSCRSLREMHSR